MATPTLESPPHASTSAKPKAAAEDKRLKRLDMVMKRNHYQQDALIEVLHSAQETFGYLEIEVLHYIARTMKVPLSRVYGVATFYHLFSMEPAGEHTCVVCMGTACYVKGSDKVLAALEEHLGVKSGETTADGKVSLAAARCIGACGIAPAVVFDGAVAPKQTSDMVIAKMTEWQGS